MRVSPHWDGSILKKLQLIKWDKHAHQITDSDYEFDFVKIRQLSGSDWHLKL